MLCRINTCVKAGGRYIRNFVGDNKMTNYDFKIWTLNGILVVDLHDVLAVKQNKSWRSTTYKVTTNERLYSIIVPLGSAIVVNDRIKI